ncbi:MAG: helix-turn-helix transcriptional regulator [Clostridia bacterium]|nr:helix-turn-helix transcriptional regulator [Clostridia bacterium]
MNLKEIRKAKKLTQRQVADFLICSPTVYSRYETGERQPPVEVLIRLSDFFGVTVDYLVGKEKLAFDGLTEIERELVRNFRRADERARDDAMTLLRLHSISAS